MENILEFHKKIHEVIYFACYDDIICINLKSFRIATPTHFLYPKKCNLKKVQVHGNYWIKNHTRRNKKIVKQRRIVVFTFRNVNGQHLTKKKMENILEFHKKIHEVIYFACYDDIICINLKSFRIATPTHFLYPKKCNLKKVQVHGNYWIKNHTRRNKKIVKQRRIVVFTFRNVNGYYLTKKKEGEHP